MKKSDKAASGLSSEALRHRAAILAEYELDECGMLILDSALTAFDRLRAAQAIIAVEGVVCKDRFGQSRQHPATLIERDAKTSMLNNLKALGLDVLPLNDKPGRPPKGF